MVYKCGFKDCEEYAICALRNKTTNDLVNVCAYHFQGMKGYPYTDDPLFKTGFVGVQQEFKEATDG